MGLRIAISLALTIQIFMAGWSQTDYDRQGYTLADGLPSNLVSCAAQDGRGLLWLGTWRGLCCYDGYEFMSFNTVGDESQRPLCSRIHSITPDKDNNIWVITYDSRLYLFDTHRCTYTDVSQLWEERFGRPHHIANVYALDNGAVWVRCFEKDSLIFRITDIANLRDAPEETANVKAGQWSDERKYWKQKKRTIDTTGIPGIESVEKYTVDAQGNIWGLGHRLTRITPKKRMFSITDTGTNRATRTVADHPDIDGKPVYATLVDSRGRRWTGTKGGGLYLDEGGRRRHFTNNKDNAYSLTGNDVYDIFEDSRGRIWVACFDTGFNLVDDGHDVRFVNSNNRLPYPRERFGKVRHITETADGEIILSTADGIVAFDGRTDRPEDVTFHTYTQSRKPNSLPGGNVMQTLQGSDGRLYISTMTGGLLVMTKGRLLDDDVEFGAVDGMQNNSGVVLSFVEDDAGNLWMARESYLEKYDTSTGRSQVYGMKEFGREIFFSEALPVYDRDSGTMTFGIYGGTLAFDPHALEKSDMEPGVLFSSVQYQGEQEREPILYSSVLDVPADRRALTIFFSALDYRDNSATQYAYKLVDAGYDTGTDKGDGWNYVGKAHCAAFNNLPPGHLKLLVKSTNADGVWSDDIAQLSIYSHPTFGETPWAWALYCLAVLSVMGVVVYIVLLRARHRRERQDLEHRMEALLRSIETADQPQSKPAEEIEETDMAKPVTFMLPEVKIESEEKAFMEKLMAYLDANISNNALKIGDLADHIGMGRTVFYERVKAITGMSPVDFVRYLRIQRVKQMLVTTDLSVSQIAYETGFSDPNYLGKVFKQSTGQSPLLYRKSASEKK